LINHSGGTSAQHIVMVDHYRPETGELVTIEGNTHGIRADEDGKTLRNNKGSPEQDWGRGTSVGLHIRDMLGPEERDSDPKDPKGNNAYQHRDGVTVLGAGRLSMVDVEDHRYAQIPIEQFPEEALLMGPTEMENVLANRVGLKAASGRKRSSG
jgi:hypothetical protein